MSVVHILYRNWRGITAWRSIRPQQWVFMQSEWHGSKKQWHLVALDVHKQEKRYFALTHIRKWME